MRNLRQKRKIERRGTSNTKPIIFFLLELIIISQILFFLYIVNIYVFYILIPIAIAYIFISPLPRLTDVYRRIDKIKSRRKAKRMKNY